MNKMECFDCYTTWCYIVLYAWLPIRDEQMAIFTLPILVFFFHVSKRFIVLLANHFARVLMLMMCLLIVR